MAGGRLPSPACPYTLPHTFLAGPAARKGVAQPVSSPAVRRDRGAAKRGSRAIRPGSSQMSQRVYTLLLRSISSFKVRPGERLIEEELASDFALSRTPVREALLRLEQEGLVLRNNGWFVCQPDPATAQNVFELREAIEGFAARLAAQRIDDAAVAALAAVLERMERATEQVEANRLNDEFHDLVTAASANDLLVAARGTASIQYWNFRTPIVFSGDQLAEVNLQHRELLDALRRRDEAAAERVAREHVRATAGVVLDGLRSLRSAG